MEKIKCNNCKIKDVESFKYLGSKTVTNEEIKKKLQKIKYARKFHQVVQGTLQK
jgi:hypothetical protein